MIHKSGLLVALVSLVAPVASTYIMDDRNTSISYSPSYMITPFATSEAYDGTITGLGGLPECLTSDNCQMTVHFTGSGITLYAYIAYALSFNISIDGMAISQFYFNGVYGCCIDASPVYNFTIYDVQNLPLGSHVLVLRLLDTSGYLVNGYYGSTLDFDYAVVNEAATPPPVPPSPHQRLGPCLGGALGIMAALALAILAVIYIRRRAHKRGAEGPDNPIIVPDKQEQEQPVIAAGLHHDPAPVSSLGESSSAGATATYQPHAEGEVPLTTAPLSTEPSYEPPHYETPIPPTPQSRAEEESLFLARMYRLGVPATEIARVAEGMRAQGLPTRARPRGALVEVVNTQPL